MGGGVAREACDNYPQLPTLFGKFVLQAGNHVQCHKLSGVPFHLVAFPTKDHPSDPSTIELITRSCQELTGACELLGFERVLLPRPGVGLGRLDWEKQVKPICEEHLDNRVVVITF